MGWKPWKCGKQPYIKIIVAMVLMAVIPSLIIECISGAFLVRTMKDVQIRSLQNNSKVVSQYISDFFQEQKRDSQFLISNSAMRALLQFEYQGDTDQKAWWAGEVQDMLQNSVTYQANISYARLVDRDGQVVASSVPEQIGTDLKQTQMYQKMLEGDSQYTEIMVDKEGKRSLKLALPLLIDGQLIGIFEKVINFQGLEAYMNHKNVDDDSYLYLIGPSQGFFYHRQRDQMILPNGGCNDGFELEDLMGLVSGGGKKFGMIRYRMYGKNITAAYQQIPSLNWFVVSAIDETDFVDAIDALNLSVAMAGILMGGIAAWLGYRFTNRSIKNYQALSNAFASILDDSEEVTEIKIRDLPGVLDYVNQTRERVRTVQNRVRVLEGSDCLTGLYNRLGMERVFAEELSGRKKTLAALLLDLDSVTFLNQKKRIAVGTAAASEIGRLVNGYIGEACTAGRMSNEEFMIFYYDWNKGSDPEKLAEQLCLDVEDIMFLEQNRVFLTASIGLYLIKEGDHFDQIYESCADALFQAKKEKKNRVAFYEDPLAQKWNGSSEQNREEPTAKYLEGSSTHNEEDFSAEKPEDGLHEI